MKRHLFLILTVCFILSAVICSVSTAAVNVTGIEVSGPTELARGHSGQFKAVVSPTNASNQNVKWSVSVNGKKTERVTIDQSGKVTVKSDAAVGSVITVKATALDGTKVSGSIKFTVKVPVNTATIQNSSGKDITGKTVKIDLSKTKTYTLKAISDPAKASGLYSWKSSDKETATVTKKGTVSFLKNGNVTITATTRDGTRKTASVTFNVITSVTGIDLSGLGPVEAGETRTIKAKVSPSTASNKTLEWSVSLNGKKTKYVSIADGKITVKEDAPVGGIIKVVAAATDGSEVFTSGEMKITGPIPVKTITIEGTGAVNAGGSRQLKAVIEPADATNKKVKWSVVLDGQKSDLVSISKGNVTVDNRVSGGSVITVTAAAADNSGVSAKAKMRVDGPIKVKSITIEGAGTIKAGGSRTLTAVVEPANADNKKVKWAVSLDGQPSDLVAISNGKVTVNKNVRNGAVVTVQAKAADGSGVKTKVKMTVNAPVLVTLIKLEGIGDVPSGGSRNVSAVVEPSNASTKTVEWSVLLDGKKSKLVGINNGKITVDKSVPGGSILTVKAAATDGSGIFGQKKVFVVSARPVESINLSGSDEIARGASVRIRSAVKPSDAEIQKLKWTIKEGDKDISYASVSASGTVTINKNAPAGTVLTVKAEATDGSRVKAVKNIRVTEPVQSLSILNSSGHDISGQNREIRLNKSKELQLGISASPSGSSNKVTWTSSNKGVAEVSGGKVTFYKNGTVTITAAAADGSGKEASVYLTGKTYITDIDLSGSDKIIPGGTQKVTAKVEPKDAENKKLNWYGLLNGRTSRLVHVKDGEVSLDYRAPVGSVLTVVAEAADGSGIRAMTEMEVIQWIPVSNIKLKGSGAIAQGKSVKLKASVTPAEATNKKVKWSLFFRGPSHPNVEITSNGTVKIGNDVPVGTTFDVRAESTDGSGIYAEKTIRVVQPIQYLSILDINGMNMTGGSFAVRLNESREVRLTAGTWPEGTSDEFTWTSSDPNIAAVNSKGTVTFIHDGVVTITVTAKDGTGATASVYLSGLTFVSDIRIDPMEEYIDPGETRMVSASVFPANAANKDLSWYTMIDGQQSPLAGVSNGQLWVSPNAQAGSLLTVIAMAVDGSGVQAYQTIRIGRPIPVQSINLSGSETAYPGTSVSVRADVSPYNATNQDLNWTIQENGFQPSYARISEDGTVTIDNYAPAGSILTVMASATDGSNVTGVAYIRIVSQLQFVMIQDTAGMNLSGQMLNIRLNGQNMFKLQAVPYPADVMTGFVWQSSDPSVASVDDSGNVLLCQDGTAVITATAMDGSNKSASVTLTVITQPPLSRIRIESSGEQAEDGTLICSLNRTNVIQLTAVPEPFGAEGNFVWMSSDPETASVNPSGRVMFRGAGEAVITVYDTISGISTEITVRAQHTISSIEIIGPDPNFIQAGKRYPLSAKIIPGNAEQQELTWSVTLNGKRSTQISISETGVLKCGLFLKKGAIATVTAAAADGSGVTGELQIPVLGKPNKIILTDAMGLYIASPVTVSLNTDPELYIYPHAQPNDSLELFELSLSRIWDNSLPTIEYRAENCEDCVVPQTEYLYFRPYSAGSWTFKIYSTIAPGTAAYLTVNAVN